jgi:3-hydroxybutyryl-CoA dehydrogenase
MAIGKIMVIGAGQMGAGIAQVASQAGHEVFMRDIEGRFIDRGMATITRVLDRAVEKGKIDAAARDAVLGRIHPTLDLGPAAGTDLVIEAAIENLELKRGLFKELDALCPPAVIFASNTSSLSITELAAATGRGDRFIGMHFFNPVPLMQLVEIIRGLQTADETHRVIFDLAQKFGKTPVTVNDYPGFISNRVLMPMINEAVYCLMEGVATAEDIDTVMKLGMNHPMGPLALADFIGLDTCLAIMEVLYHGYSDSKYRPCPLLRKMVRAGYLGRKSGRGFYTY